MGPTWWDDLPEQIRMQSCCDLLLGKINHSSSSSSSPPGSAAGEGVVVVPGWDDHFLHFSGRRPCARGSRPLEPDGRCLSHTCCRRTRLQVAQWDHHVRGRCWVLRKPKKKRKKTAQGSKNDDDDGGGQEGEEEESDASTSSIRVSVTAAYGIIGITTVFVLVFRLVTRKLDECHRRQALAKMRS